MKPVFLLMFGLLVVIVIIIAIVWSVIAFSGFAQITVIDDPRPMLMTNTNFAVFPKTQFLFKGQKLMANVGIKNDASSFEAQKFVINIIPDNPAAQNWYEYPTSPRLILPNLKSVWIITFSPPVNAPGGKYAFTIIACSDPIPSPEECTLETGNWAEPQDIVLTITE